MAPEILALDTNPDYNRKGWTDKADIWSVGVIVYELITGVRPFEAQNLADLISR
jgi:serine/threonine protein kinase